MEVKKISTTGRITIIKTLIIPKLNHLILSLPKAKTECLKTFEKDIFHIVLGCKVHKVMKSTITSDYSHGGLKIVDYGYLTQHLKLLG